MRPRREAPGTTTTEETSMFSTTHTARHADTCDRGSHVVAAVQFHGRRAARAALEFVGGWVPVVLVAGILFGTFVVAPLRADAAPVAPVAPLPLTLDDAHGWTPTAVLDTTQVEAPEYPIGTALDAAIDTAWLVLDTGAEVGWVASSVASGWTLLAPGTIVDPDGTAHDPCLALVGPTTHVICADGWEDES